MKKIKKIEHSKEWHEQRSKGIGGSDAGAILGFNPYKSAYTLWAEKTGKIDDEIPDNEAMRLGRDLEDYVAKRFCEATGKKVKRSNFSYQSEEHPFMLANVDRLVVGEKAGLECKTTNMLTRTNYEAGDIPPSYYAQCQHYMAVTGLEKWYIAILVMNKGFYWYEILRSDEEIKALIDREAEFWKCVENDVEPNIDGSDSTSETILKLHPKGKGDAIDLALDQEAENLFKLKKQKKELDEEIKKIENRFKHDMGDAETAFTKNGVFTFKNYISNRPDNMRLKKEYPEVYANILDHKESRRFVAKER